MDDRSRLFRPMGSVELTAPPFVSDGGTAPTATTTATATTTHWTASPHAFSGAVLSPKHARELTPSSCLQIASSLAEQSPRRTVVPYTLWITEAWRVLGWAEPSAALFWEMATMYHTLFLAGRAYAAEYENSSQDGNNLLAGGGGGAAASGGIPPILSVGSASSVGSGTTHQSTTAPVTFDKKKFATAASAKELPVWLVGTFLLLHCEEFAFWRNLSGKDDRRFFDAGAAEGIEVGVDGTALRSGSTGSSGSHHHHQHHHPAHTSSSSSSSSLFLPSLSPRTQLHAGWGSRTNHGHCAAYLLRHLRKVLLLTAVPHNPEAVNACMHLAVLPSPPWLPTEHGHTGSNYQHQHYHSKYRVDDLRRQHDDEHGQVGLNVQLSLDDLERLHLVLQPPQGGGIDDPPLRLGDYLWSVLKYPRGRSHTAGPPPPVASLPLAEVERELRRHLEWELEHPWSSLSGAGDRGGGGGGRADRAEATAADPTAAAMAKLSLQPPVLPSSSSAAGTSPSALEGASTGNVATPQEFSPPPPPSAAVASYYKELSYTQLRGTTILLKPNPTETSSGASAASGEPHFVGNLMNSQRLHDLVISDCSDAHFYLLQPFEHATISACTGCTIVVGAVAGLLHIVDCEKTNITSASRRLLVSNCSDVSAHIFSPSPPILVGDNRTCQFAPYNTYYDGLREDLLVTGLAAAVMSELQSPYHGRNGNGEDASSTATNSPPTTPAAAWPPLQCASNKWKLPVEMSKLEMPEVPAQSSATTASPSSSSSSGSTATGVPSPPSSPTGGATDPGADDKAMKGAASGQGEATLHSAPVLISPSDFHMLFVPVETEASRQRRLEEAAAAADEAKEPESLYCRMLSEILHFSPFSLPVEYERSVLGKADRIRTIQQKVRTGLTPEQQQQVEEELNRGFREWLVTSGNLRQVLDLVHMEERRDE